MPVLCLLRENERERVCVLVKERERKIYQERPSELKNKRKTAQKGSKMLVRTERQ